MRAAVSYIRVSKPKQGRSGLGLVPPPGKPDSQPIGRQRLYNTHHFYRQRGGQNAER